MGKIFHVTLTILLTAAVLLASGCGKSGSEPGAFYDKEAGISYEPPAGWTIGDMPGIKHKMAFGPAANGFAPNVVLAVEVHSGDLKSYVKANQETVAKVFTSYTQVGSGEFETESGLKGIWNTYEGEQQGTPLRQRFFYIGPNRSRYYVLACTSLKEGGAALDAAFDEAMKSVQFH